MQLHQQKGMISLSPPTICNSALKKIRPVVILFHYGESWNLLRADQRLIFAKSWPRASRYQQGALLQS
ncbi:Transposase [Acinetobacter baumannii 1656-2]|nr:Transposase [Acinetobacter baumannii 1656-2]